MNLPFTHEQFLDVFGAFNTALWPFAILLWVATLVVIVQLWRGRIRPAILIAVLAVHWAWSGIAFHAAFFARINPAARMFAVLFVLEAIAFVWFGLVRRRLAFDVGRTPRHVLAAVFVAYSFVYPALALLIGLRFPRAPVYGVPCPTTLLTAGLLLAAPQVPRWALVIPILWGVIGGSAALVLGVTPDLMLFAAALAMLVYAVIPRLLTREVVA